MENIIKYRDNIELDVISTSRTFKLEKGIGIEIPHGLIGYIYTLDKSIKKLDSGIYDYHEVIKLFGKDYKNEQIYIKYYNPSLLGDLSFGVPIENVYNKYNDETYKIGVRGNIQFEIDQPISLINSFGKNEVLTKIDVEKKIKEIVRDVGRFILIDIFTNTKESVLNRINIQKEYHDCLFRTIKNEKRFAEIGVSINDVKIVDFYLPDESFEKVTRNNSEIKVAQLEILKEDLQAFLDNRLDELKTEMLPLYEKAKDSYVSTVKINTDILIEEANTDEEFSTPASRIYCNIDKNFIEKFHLRYEDRKYAMTIEEYDEMINSFYNEGASIKKGYNPNYIGVNLVEMPSEFKFYKCGLSKEDSMEASKIWTLLNKFRHSNPENDEKLARALTDRKMSKKEFLKYALNFYRSFGLFTLD